MINSFRAFIAILLLLFSLISTAQKADSLEALLKKHPEPDTTRLSLLTEFVKYSYDTEKNKKALAEGFLLAKKLNHTNLLGKCYFLKAAEAYDRGDDAEYQICIDSAFILYTMVKNSNGLFNVWRAKGLKEQRIGNYGNAITNYTNALKIAENIKDNKLIGIIYDDLAAVNLIKGNFLESQRYYYKSLKLFEEQGLQNQIALSYFNLGLVNRNLKKFNTALNFYRQSLAVSTRLKDNRMIAVVYHGIAVLYDIQEKKDSILYYERKATHINRQNGFEQALATNLNSIGIVYKDLNQYDSAYFYLTEARSLFNKLKSKKDIVATEINIGELYCSAPETFFGPGTISKTKRYTEAEKLFEGVLKFAQDAEAKDEEQTAWEGLSEVYKKQGLYQKAFEALQKYISIKDSLLNAENIEATTRQAEQIEFEKKYAITETLHHAQLQQQRTVKNSISAGSGILLLGGLLSFFFYRRKRNAVEKQKEAEFKTEVAETEMKALRAQMNPHFMFNSLNSIGDYISHNKNELAGDYLAKFAKLMRLVLENSEKKEIVLADDLKALELYMQLEARRMNHKFSYELNVDANIDPETTLVPPLLLQPFVENSIWHGIAKKQGTGKIIISVIKEDDMIKCVVEDDGIGRQEAISHQDSLSVEKKSLGMKITNARISILNKVKNTTAGVQLFDLAQGTKVELKLPFETY
jgi:tetratricopeptide (TPR) repeat protein